MYTCDHFTIRELVPPIIHKARGYYSWELLDERMLRTLDRLRARYGPITVNDWHWGGVRQWSGLRTPQSPSYSPTSQHTFGRAADCLFFDVTPDEVRRDMLADPDHPDFALIGSIELDTSWLHFDVRNCDRIKTYRPG